ncbi:MAG: hypothetical protein K9M54_09565 [Kiritimatiellales bacterium]|nr:hypothetical protein [Kiritimatiellales bacterium]MCF7864224.1 hypothetical protein [Kiritimatiellales bacterium]
MGCKKGESKHEKKPGHYECKKCGAVVKKKDKVCQPKKIKDGDLPKK